MSLLDVLTGGENKRARNALNRAQSNFDNIATPTAADLTLPELQKYVQAGILTPAQAQAYLQEGNAFNDINLDPSSTEAQTDALSKLKSVSDAKGMTPQMQAQLTAALDRVATDTRGNNAAITENFSQRGIPASLMAEAAMREEAGTGARDANLAATEAAGQAEQNAINAMMNEGNLATTMHGQQYSEAAQKAQAENAMREWNAGAKNTTSEANAGRQERANEYNTGVGQDISNQNTGLANKRTEYNANVPQQVFNNAITKAGGQSTVAGNQAKQATDAGNQQMGLYGALIGGGATVLAADGGEVPGRAPVPGDSPQNDIVHARLSPGEAVIPRSVMNSPNAPDQAKRFVSHLLKNPVKPAHPDDVHTIMKVLEMRRAS